MLKVKLGDRELKIYFQHERKMMQHLRNKRAFAKGADPDICRQMTPVSSKCFIKDGEEIIAEGSSHCCPQDQFSYAQGRKEALSDTIENSNFSLPERVAIWNQILTTCPKTIGVKA